MKAVVALPTTPHEPTDQHPTISQCCDGETSLPPSAATDDETGERFSATQLRVNGKMFRCAQVASSASELTVASA